MTKVDDYRQLIDEIVKACEARKQVNEGTLTEDAYEAMRANAVNALAKVLKPKRS